MPYSAAGDVQQDMQTAAITFMTALVRVDGGQKESMMIEPTKAAARNSDLMKSMPSLIGSATILSPDATQHSQAVFIERPFQAYEAVKPGDKSAIRLVAANNMIANCW